MRLRAAALGGGAARRDHLLARAPTRRGPTPRTRSRAATWCSTKMARAGLHHRRSELRRSTPQEPIPTPRTRSSRRPRTPRPPTSPPGCASSWSTATAPARRSAAACRSRRRSTSSSSAQVEAIVASRRSAGSSRPRRSSCSTTRPPASGRWSAAPTTRRRRSTSPPTATASPARRSSRSPWSPRSSRGARPSEVFTSAPAGDPVQGQGPEEERRDEDGPRALRGRQLRRHLPRLAPRWPPRTTYSDNSVYAQLGHPGRARERRRDGEEAGDRDRPLDRHRVLDRRRRLRAVQPGDDPRRPRGRRHAAGDGPRLQHAGAATAAGSRARWPPTPAARSGSSRCTDGDGDDECAETDRRRPAARTRSIDEQVIDARGRRPPRRASSRPWSTSGTGENARRPASPPGARPAPPTTTATPGSAAPPRRSPPASGSATPTRTRRWRPSSPAQPVDGGTFPALIFADIVNACEELQAARKAEEDPTTGDGGARPGRRPSHAHRPPSATTAAPPSEPLRRPSRSNRAEPAAPGRRPSTDDPTGGGVGAPRPASPRLSPRARERNGCPRRRSARAVDGLRDPDPGPGDDLDALPRALAPAQLERRRSSALTPVSSSPIPSACGELARARAERRASARGRGASRIPSSPSRLERADQHRGGARPRARRRSSAGCGSRRRGRRRRGRAGRTAPRCASVSPT